MSCRMRCSVSVSSVRTTISAWLGSVALGADLERRDLVGASLEQDDVEHPGERLRVDDVAVEVDRLGCHGRLTAYLRLWLWAQLGVGSWELGVDAAWAFGFGRAGVRMRPCRSFDPARSIPSSWLAAAPQAAWRPGTSRARGSTSCCSMRARSSIAPTSGRTSSRGKPVSAKRAVSTRSDSFSTPPRARAST